MLTYFYPQTYRMIVTALLDMFNDMRVVKYDKDGTAIAEKIVPITFSPSEKHHRDRTENNWVDSQNVQHGNRYYLTIPRLALKPTGIIYDGERATGVNQWRFWNSETPIDQSTTNAMHKVLSDYAPTPFNFNFELSIMSDSQDYFAQIIENILPYFNPQLMLRVKEFSFLNIERDLRVSMDGLNIDFSDDLSDTESRQCNGTINLTVQGYMYRPFVWSDIIKVINSKYYIGDTSTSALPVIDSYSTSGYMSSGGVPYTSAVPSVDAYQLSGDYMSTTKEFIWFENHISNKK